MRSFAKGRDIMAHDARIARRRRRRALYPLEVIMTETTKGKRGGARPNTGGAREGAGRPQRNEPKSKPIWCGQHTDAQRDLIIQNLTPEERLAALLAAAQAKRKTS